MTQRTLFGSPKADNEKPPRRNPCLKLYGLGPEGARCGTCKHLVRFRRGGTWYKCDLRTMTHGANTDHRVRWPACGRYVLGRVQTVDRA